MFIAGGKQGVQALRGDPKVPDFIWEAYKHYKAIGAFGEGAELLAAAGIGTRTPAGADASAVPSSAETGAEPSPQPGIVTARKSKELAAFSQQFIDAVAQHRHWARSI